MSFGVASQLIRHGVVVSRFFVPATTARPKKGPRRQADPINKDKSAPTSPNGLMGSLDDFVLQHEAQLGAAGVPRSLYSLLWEKLTREARAGNALQTDMHLIV